MEGTCWDPFSVAFYLHKVRLLGKDYDPWDFSSAFSLVAKCRLLTFRGKFDTIYCWVRPSMALGCSRPVDRWIAILLSSVAVGCLSGGTGSSRVSTTSPKAGVCSGVFIRRQNNLIRCLIIASSRWSGHCLGGCPLPSHCFCFCICRSHPSPSPPVHRETLSAF